MKVVRPGFFVAVCCDEAQPGRVVVNRMPVEVDGRDSANGLQRGCARIDTEVAVNSLRVDVLAYEAPCERCSFSFWWVLALLPSHRPRGDEFTTTDFPEAVEMARNILADPDSEIGLREQLSDRPVWQRGRSFNPNRCHACGHQADWHAFEKILDRAIYGDWIHAAEGCVPVVQWRAIRGGGQGIYWPHC